MKIQDLYEAKRKSSRSIWNKFIPDAYKQYPIIGYGDASVVMDKGNDTVLMLTRDPVKEKYLTMTKLGKTIRKIFLPHVSLGLNSMPVYVIEMPKLYPLDTNNKKIVSNFIKEFENLNFSEKQYMKKYPNDIFSHIFKLFFEHKFNKISNIDMSRYENYLQDNKGNIVIVDPFVGREVIKAWRSREGTWDGHIIPNLKLAYTYGDPKNKQLLKKDYDFDNQPKFSDEKWQERLVNDKIWDMREKLKTKNPKLYNKINWDKFFQIKGIQNRLNKLQQIIKTNTSDL